MAHNSKTTKSPTPPRPGDPWVTVAEAAKLLGRHRHTINGMAARGELESTTLAGKLFIAWKSVEAHLLQQVA